MRVPTDLKYTDSHEWIRIDGDIITVGITDHAQDQLTDLVYVKLPMPGRRVKAREDVAVVESVKTASDVYAPVAGEIIEVNDELENNPGRVNEDPYGDGWLYKLEVKNPEDLEDLLEPAAYQKLTR
jgi:glycine cleavage system H protein